MQLYVQASGSFKFFGLEFKKYYLDKAVIYAYIFI